MADEFEDLNKSQKEFTDNFKESMDFLRDAIVSLGDRLNEALKQGIANTNQLDDATKRVANRYRRELEGSIDKVIIGTDTLKELQLKVNKGLDISKDISSEINKLETEKEKILSRVESLKRQGIDLEEETQTLLKFHIQDQNYILKNLQKENKAREDSLGLLGKLAEGSEHVLQHVDKSGKLSKALGLEDAIHKTREFATHITNSGKQTAGLGGKMQIASNLIGNIGKNLLKAFGPLWIVAEILETIIHMDKVVGETAKKLGVSYNEAFKLKGEMSKVAVTSNDVFSTSQNILEAYLAINESLGTRVQLSNEELITFNELTKRAGYSVELANELVKLGALTGKSSKEQSKEFLGQARAIASQNKLVLNEKQLFEGITKLSSNIKLTLNASTEKIAEAVVKAKQLGLELGKIDGIANSLLDFESSLSSEVTAQLFTGKEYDLDLARRYALEDNMVGLAEEMSKHIGTSAEWSKKNRMEKEAEAAVWGMNKDDIAQIIMDREVLQKLSAKDGETAKQAWDRAVKEKGLMGAKIALQDEVLANQMASTSMQEEFNQLIEKLKEIFVDIAKPLMAIIKPIADVLVPALSFIGRIIQTVLVPVTWAFKKVWEGVVEIFSPLGDLFNEFKSLLNDLGIEGKDFKMIVKAIGASFSTILGVTVTIGKAIVKFLIEPLKGIGKLVKGIVKIFKGDFEGGIKDISESMAKFIMSPFQLITDLVIGTINKVIKEVNELKIPGIKIETIPVPDLASLLPKVNDAIIPPGNNRILTRPEGSIRLNDKDTIIAGTNLNKETNTNKTKETKSTNVHVVDNKEILNEIKSVLIQLLNKDSDIYLDGLKIGDILSTGRASYQ